MPTNTTVNWYNVTLPGGELSDVRMTDGSEKFMLFGGNRRIRLTRLSDAERNDAAKFEDKMRGDMIFNTTSGKAEIWDGLVWRALW